MSGLKSFREKYPQYNDLSDQELANKLYTRYYSDMPRGEFNQRMGLSVAAPATSKPEAPKEGGSRAAELMRGITSAGAFVANPAAAIAGEVIKNPGLIPEAGRGVMRGLGYLAQMPRQYGIQIGSQVASEARSALKAIEEVDAGRLKPTSPNAIKLMQFLERQSQAGNGLEGFNAPSNIPQELVAASEYAAASPKEKKEIKQALANTASETDAKVAERIAKVKEAQAQAQAKYPASVPQFTDIRSPGDFFTWGAGAAGEAVPQLAPVMAAAAITRSPAAVGALSAGMTLPEQVDARIDAILEETKDKPPEERLPALTDYIANTYGTSALVSAVVGGIDSVSGPVGTLSKGLLKIGKEAPEVAARSIKQAIVQGAKRAPKEIGQEALTGGAQEVVGITGERFLGEQGEDPALSVDNIKRVLNSAAAEVAGGFAGAVINTGLDAAASKMRGTPDPSPNAIELATGLTNQLVSNYQNVDPEVADIYGKIASDRITATALENGNLTRAEAATLVGEQQDTLLDLAVQQVNAKRAAANQSPVTAPQPAPTGVNAAQLTGPSGGANGLPAPATAPTPPSAPAGGGTGQLTGPSGATAGLPPPPNQSGVPATGAAGATGASTPGASVPNTGGMAGTKPPAGAPPAGTPNVPGQLKGGAAETLAPYRQEIGAKVQDPNSELSVWMNESGNVPKPGATAKAREAWAKRVDKFATTAAAVLQLVDTASDPSELSALETQYGELPRTFTGEINRDALITRIAQVELAAKSRKAAATATPKEGTPDETVPDEVVPEAKPPTAEELAQRIPDVQEKDLTNLLNANSTGTSFDDRLRTVAEAIADESDDPNALPATMAGLKKALKGASEAMASGSRGIDYLKDNYKNYVAEALAKAKVDLNVAAAEKEQRGTQEKLRNEWEDEKSLQRIESQIQEAAQALGRTPLDTESDPEPLRADGTLVQVKLNDGTVVELERDEKSGNWLVYDKVKNLKNKDIDRLLVSTPHEWGEAGSEQALEDRDTAEQGLGLDLTDAALAKLPEYVQRQRIRFLAARNELRIQREQQGIKPKAPEGPAPDATLKTKGTLAEFAEDDVDAAMDNEPIPQEAPPEAPTGEAATPESYSALVDSLKPYLQARFDEIRRAMDAALAGESLLTPKDVAKLAARIATQNHEFSQTPNGVAVKGALGSMFATIADYASRAPSLSRRVDMLLRRFDMGKVSVEALAEELGQIYESHILRKADKALANLRADRVRGPNIIREKMLKAVREGALSQETYDFFDWLLRQNENIAQDLAISIRSPKRSTLHFSGSYSVLGRLMTLFKYHADDDTAVHEVMHHTEAMMPEDMREAVRKSWAKAIEAAQRKYANDRDAAAFFFFAQKAEYGLAFEQLQHSVLPANEFYQLISPSEFWAVNATNILRGRYEARGSMLMRMRNFMKELIEHLKSGLGLRSDYAVIRGLNSVLRGDGVYEAGVTLDQNASVLFQAKKARAAGAPKKLRDMQKRIAASMSAQDPEAMRKLGKSIEELSGKKIGAEDSRKILARLWDAQSVDVANGTLNLVPVRDVVNMFRKDIPKINDIFKYVDQIIQFRTKVLRDTDAIVDRWQKLVNKFPKGAEAIAQLLVYADYLNFYPLAYKNLTEALARDPVLKEAKQKGNQTEAVKRANDLRAFYEGGVSDDGTPIYGWNDLSKPEFGGGQAKVIFRDSQKAQDTLFKEKTDAMMAKAGRISGNSVYASQLARLLTERIMKAREKKVFSPLMRFGQYWVNIKDHKGFKGGLFSFEDKKQRDEFLAIKRAQYEHNQLPNDLITEGNSLAELRAIMTNRSMRQAFDQIMDLVDRVDILGASGPGASSTYSKDDFKNDVAELFLETLSENDYRKMFQSRKYTPGFSLDALRVFIANQTKQANQLARLKYQEELDLIHAEAIKDLEGKPRSAALKTVVDHVYREVSGLSSGNPPIPPLATAANRIVFFYLLSGLSTAVINTTQTMYSFAYMLNRYGVRAPAAVARGLVKMISPWNPGLGMEVYDANGNRTTEWGTASYINSQEHRTLKKTNPGLYDCLEAVWHHGNDLERFSGEVSRELYERSGTPSDQFGFGVLKKPLRSETLGKAAGYAARKAVDAFGFAFHHVERLTREGTYITCARLEYQKARREGAPHDEAKARAIAAADDMSLETMGDTSTVGRPPVITKTWQGRVMGSLTWYSVFTAGFMTRNIYRLTQGDPEARKLALHLLGASIVTTYMFSGITGQLLYLPVIAAIDMVRRVAAALGDDDDDKEKLPFEDSEGHPTGSYSADLEFKTSILPRLFGPDSEWAKFFGWDEKQAEKFVRGLKYGPISSYTDLNFFNSMSLGGLLRYPSGFQEARSVEEAMNAIGVLDLAPIGSVGLRIGRGLDALRKGENYKAMENFLPAAMSNWVKALRLEKQGLITPDNYEVKAKEFYDLGKRAAQGIGFGSTEAHEKYQEQYLLPGKIEKSVAARKAALTSGYKSAVYLYNKNYSEAAEKRLEKVREKIRAFNHQFPADAIDWNDLEKNTTEYIDIRNSADATGVKDIEAVSKYAPGLLDNRQQ